MRREQFLWRDRIIAREGEYSTRYILKRDKVRDNFLGIALKSVEWLETKGETEEKFTRPSAYFLALFTLVKCNHTSTFAEYKNIFYRARNVFIRRACVGIARAGNDSARV